MHLTLNRFLYHPFGIFSRWLRDDGSQLMVTITHAFGGPGPSWLPATPPGEYLMRRGQPGQFPKHPGAFEITNVPGHTAILLHTGNFNEDSKGCEVVGEDVSIGEDPHTQEPTEMVTNSSETYKKFMAEMEGYDEVELTINA